MSCRCGKLNCKCSNKSGGGTGPTGATGTSGSTGATGATGASGSASSLLKFSGQIAGGEGGLPVHLSDIGTLSASVNPIDYPMAGSHTFQNMSVNVKDAFTTGSITFQLIHNGAPVVGFLATINGPFVPGSPVGVLTPPEVMSFNDTFDLLVTPSGVDTLNINVSASIGVI